MPQNRIHNILWSGSGRANFIFAAAGFLTGFTMLLLALHLYKNVFEPVNTAIKNENTSTYLILNKTVALTNSLGLSTSYFTEREIENINEQPFIKRTGLFTSNQFKAYINIKGVGGSDLPVESVESVFLDTVPPNWGWETGDKVVPIILSNEFVNLYNFVMAPSWNTPQISKEAMRNFPMELYLSGRGLSENFNAKVVGYSDRIVSVLVPQSFMTWANTKFAGDERSKPNRIIVEVTDASDRQLLNFLDKNDYETNRDKLKSNARSIISILIIVVSVFGFLLFILALFLFLTTFSLLIARQQNDIELLFQIGYDIKSVRKVWIRRFSIWLAILFVMSIAVLLLVNYAIVGIAASQALAINKNVSLVVYVTGIVMLGIVLLYNQLRIQRALRNIYS